MTDRRIDWLTPSARTLEEMRKVIDDDLQRIADITQVPRALLAPLDESDVSILESRRRDRALNPGTIPLHWNLGDDSFVVTMNDPIPIPKTKTKDKTMSHELPNGGTLFAKLTICGDSEDGTLTAYETLLDAARRIGVPNETDITVDEDADPTIEALADEIDLHALADLLQPRKEPFLDKPEQQQAGSLGSISWQGIRVPAIRYKDGSVSYCTPNGRWRPAVGGSINALDFVSGLDFDPSSTAF